MRKGGRCVCNKVVERYIVTEGQIFFKCPASERLAFQIEEYEILQAVGEI